MEREIRKAIDRALLNLEVGEVSYVVEHPGDESMGDFASNVVMSAFSGIRDRYDNPRALAEVIKGELESDEELMGSVTEIEIAGPGFINFRLNSEWFLGRLQEVIDQGDSFGRGNWGEGRKALVEYSSPNIAKNFSVGHLRSTIIGQVIYNLYEFSGWRVTNDNHYGDWGTQFGMMIAAVEEKGLDLKKMSVDEMEELYVEYNKRAKGNEELLESAREAFKRLEEGDLLAKKIWEEAVKASKKEFERIYEVLEVEFENEHGESFYESMMPSVIEEAKKKGIAIESEGAVIVEFDQMPPAILVKSNGTTTYFTRDLATIKYRLEQLPADRYIYEVGAEQILHFRQVFAAAEKLRWARADQFVHVSHGLVLGKDGKKMSTRKGTGVKMEELLKRAVKEAGKLDRGSAEIVGVGGVKFFDLKHAPITDYVFEWSKALSLQGDTGPYVQYAAVRAGSVLEKGGGISRVEMGVGLSEEELGLLRLLPRFEEVVVIAAKNYAPNILVEYLLDLSKRFNSFYNGNKIIESENEQLPLAICAGVRQVLVNGMGILGIEIPKRM